MAGSLLVLASALILLPARHLGGERIAKACAILVIVVVLARLVEYFTGWPVGLDHWIFRASGERFGLAPVARLTISSTIAFLCVGVGLLALSASPRERLFDAMGALLGVVAVVIGLAFLLGYVYGKPLGYGREVATPLSMSAAAAFALLGFGLLLIAMSHDAAERRAARRREAAQYATTRVLLKFETLDDAMPKLLRAMGLSIHWPYAAFWQSRPPPRACAAWRRGRSTRRPAVRTRRSRCV